MKRPIKTAQKSELADPIDPIDADDISDVMISSPALLLMTFAVGHDQDRLLAILGGMVEQVLEEEEDLASRRFAARRFCEVLREHFREQSEGAP